MHLVQIFRNYDLLTFIRTNQSVSNFNNYHLFIILLINISEYLTNININLSSYAAPILYLYKKYKDNKIHNV